MHISREIRGVQVDIILLDCDWMINSHIWLRVSQNSAEFSQKIFRRGENSQWSLKILTLSCTATPHLPISTALLCTVHYLLHAQLVKMPNIS